MAVLIPNRWRRKPPSGATVRLDRTHALCPSWAWVLNEAGGTNFAEAGQRVAPGTLQGATWGASPPWGPGLSFSGGSNYASVNAKPILSPLATWSIVAGFTTTASGIAGGRPLYCERSGAGQDIVKLGTVDGNNFMKYTMRSDDTTLMNTPGTIVINDGTFHVASFSLNGPTSTFSTAVDGVVDVSIGTWLGNTLTDASDARIGGDPQGASQSFIGTVFFVYLYQNHVITSLENRELYNNPWQVIAPQPRRWFLSSGGSSPAVVNGTVGAYTWAGVTGSFPGGPAVVNGTVGAYTWAGVTGSIPGASNILLRAPFAQSATVPGPVTVQLRIWSGGTWVNDGPVQTVTQQADPHIPNSYVINALYTPNGDGSYQGLSIWNLANVSTWGAGTPYIAGNLVVPNAHPTGHYYMATVGGTSGGTEPASWPTNGTAITDGATLTWQDMGQALYDGDEVLLQASAGSASAVVTALHNDSQWQVILANANGAYTFTPPSGFPGTGTLILKDKANVTTLATLSLQFDSSGNPVIRTSS